MFSTAAALTSIALSVIAVVFSVRSYILVRQTVSWVANNTKRSIGLKKLTELEIEMTEHKDSIDALHASLKKLRGRVHARKMNEEKNAPAQETDREWARRKTAELLGARLNGNSEDTA